MSDSAPATARAEGAVHSLRCIGLPATRWMLEVGAFLLRTETELVRKSRRVLPGTLLANDFAFQFPQWPAAAADLVARWRASSG